MFTVKKERVTDGLRHLAATLIEGDSTQDWKRGVDMFCDLRAMGARVDVAAQVAGNARRWRLNSVRRVKTVLTIAYFDGLGVPRLSSP